MRIAAVWGRALQAESFPSGERCIFEMLQCNIKGVACEFSRPKGLLTYSSKSLIDSSAAKSWSTVISSFSRSILDGASTT